MTKQQISEQIRKAKVGHKRWLSYAKAIHMGIPVDKNAVPMLETDCGFGKWYYGEGQVFDKLDSFKAIEQPHAMLHNQYMRLFKARRKPVKSGFFVSKKSAIKEKNDALDKMMDQLLEISNLLIEGLNDFEEDIRNMSDFEISKFI
jgi:hypothetical protein